MSLKRNRTRWEFMQQHKTFRVDVPEGKSGIYEIARQEMTKNDALVATAMEGVMKSGRYAEPGIYTILKRFGKNGNPYDETIVMSDHLCEVADHVDLVAYAKSHAPLDRVLINGLGIGVAIELLMPYVKHITIIELSKDVIKLTAPHYINRYGDRLEIIQHNALTYRPPKDIRYNAVFHDIWDYISENNLAEMRHLQRRYGRLCDWQQSWAREYCQKRAEKIAAHPEEYTHMIDTKEVIAKLAAIINA